MIVGLILLVIFAYLIYRWLTGQITFLAFLSYVVFVIAALILCVMIAALILHQSLDTIRKNLCLDKCCSIIRLPVRLKPLGEYDRHYDLYQVSPKTSDWLPKMFA